MLIKASYKHLLPYLVFIIISIFTCQVAQGQKDVMVIDTTDYLPYPDGLNTNLLIASSKGYTSEIHRLIKLGADIDTRDFENISPLIYAVANRHLNTVKAILEYEPETDILTNSGESALHIAAKDNMLEIAETLIRADADINIEDTYSATPLHYAAAYGNFYLCDLLIYYNAEIENRGKDGNTPLIASVYSGHADISDLLLQAGSNPNLSDNKGFTPLIIAAQNNDTLLLSLLLKNGADLYSQNDYRYDALGMAIRNNHKEAYDFLIKRIDRDKYRSQKMISPVTIARKYGRSDILEDLQRQGFAEYSRLSFDHVKISAGLKTSFRDLYSRFGLSFKDPLLKIQLNAGFEMKPFTSKVLVEKEMNEYYQYFDKRYIVYAGAGKEFKIYEDYGGGIYSIDLNLNIGYMMAATYRGTNIKPGDEFKFMPQVVGRWSSNNFNIYLGYEYMKTDLYRIGPGWFVIGASYDLYFDNRRSPVKSIKWY